MRHVSMMALSGGLRMFERRGRKKLQMAPAAYKSTRDLYLYIKTFSTFVIWKGILKGTSGRSRRSQRWESKQREEVGSET